MRPDDGHDLGEIIGEGGAATVRRAVDRTTGRTVALKCSRHDAVERRVLGRRLLEEAASMGRVHHPSVPRVLTVGEDPEPWFAMELVDGETLAHVLQTEGPFAPRRALQILVQVARGLQAIHAAGLIHRDIKADNLLLTPRGEVRIVDFGIAIGPHTTVAADRVLGSVATMPPEQRASPDTVDVRADVYAAGATLYQLLTGSSPLDLHLAAAGSPRFADVPDDLIPILRRATAGDPSDRFSDAEALATALLERLPEASIARSGAPGSAAVTCTPLAAPSREPTRVVAGPRGDELALENHLRREWREEENDRRSRSRWVGSGALAVAVTLSGIVAAVAGRWSLDHWIQQREAAALALEQPVAGRWEGIVGRSRAELTLSGTPDMLYGTFAWTGAAPREDRVRGILQRGRLILKVVEGEGRGARYEAWLAIGGRLDGEYISVTNPTSFHLVRTEDPPP